MEATPSRADVYELLAGREREMEDIARRLRALADGTNGWPPLNDAETAGLKRSADNLGKIQRQHGLVKVMEFVNYAAAAGLTVAAIASALSSGGVLTLVYALGAGAYAGLGRSWSRDARKLRGELRERGVR